jgi:hypothetical protein
MGSDVDQMNKDASTIFDVISTSDFDTFEEASQAVTKLYVPDMSFSRSGISLALKKLKEYFMENKNGR